VNLQLKERINKFISIYVVRKIQLLILYLTVEYVFGSRTIEYAADQLIVLCLVRDSELYINSFIKHYFSLGVKHIVFLDNNSTDQTVAIAQQYKNVTILRTKLPFKRYKMAMRHYLISRFAQINRWVLYVDVDELFDYPYSDVINLSSLLRYLTEKSYSSVVAHMLDMFSDKPLKMLNNRVEDILKQTHRYYDVSNIVRMKYYFPRNKLPSDRIKIYFGGIRKTLFSPHDNTPFLLTKHPLFFSDGKIEPLFVDEHDVRGACIADFTGVLFHYKFLRDFGERTLRAVREENYCRNSVEYKKYLKVLRQNPDLNIKQTDSEELKSVNDLIDSQFLIISKDYVDWVEQQRYDTPTM